MSIMKRILQIAVAAAIMAGTASSGVFAESYSSADITNDENNGVYIEENTGYSREVVLENYERLMAENPPETGLISFDDGIMPYDGNIPKSYHNLAAGDYYYSGRADGCLYTLKYFSTNSDGKLFIEGYYKANTIGNAKNMWQDGVIEIYNQSTNKCVCKYTVDSDNVLSYRDYYSVSYYNFSVYNLDPNSLYYVAFINSIAPTGLNVRGYISHHVTYYFWDNVHGTNSAANFIAEGISDEDKYPVEDIKIEVNPGFYEMIDEMRRSDPLAF